MILDTEAGQFLSVADADQPKFAKTFPCLVHHKDDNSGLLQVVVLKWDWRPYAGGRWVSRCNGGWTEEHSWTVLAWFEEFS